MPEIIDYTSNGYVSLSNIKDIIDAVNHMRAWLQDIGYESNAALLTEIPLKKDGTLGTPNARGADEFRIISARVKGTLKKNQQHPTVKISLPRVYGKGGAPKSFQNVIVTPQTINAAGHGAGVTLQIVSMNTQTVEVKVFTKTAPTADTIFYVNMIGIAMEDDEL